MLAKKQIWVIFLFEFKMGHIAAETIHNINNAFDPELLKNVQCSGASVSFAKKMRALKMRSKVADDLKLTVTNYEGIKTTWLKHLIVNFLLELIHLVVINIWGKFMKLC